MIEFLGKGQLCIFPCFLKFPVLTPLGGMAKNQRVSFIILFNSLSTTIPWLQ